jgi:hypothetical protein
LLVACCGTDRGNDRHESPWPARSRAPDRRTSRECRRPYGRTPTKLLACASHRSVWFDVLEMPWRNPTRGSDRNPEHGPLRELRDALDRIVVGERHACFVSRGIARRTTIRRRPSAVPLLADGDRELLGSALDPATEHRPIRRPPCTARVCSPVGRHHGGRTATIHRFSQPTAADRTTGISPTLNRDFAV